MDPSLRDSVSYTNAIVRIAFGLTISSWVAKRRMSTICCGRADNPKAVNTDGPRLQRMMFEKSAGSTGPASTGRRTLPTDLESTKRKSV